MPRQTPDRRHDILIFQRQIFDGLPQRSCLCEIRRACGPERLTSRLQVLHATLVVVIGGSLVAHDDPPARVTRSGTAAPMVDLERPDARTASSTLPPRTNVSTATFCLARCASTDARWRLVTAACKSGLESPSPS